MCCFPGLIKTLRQNKTSKQIPEGSCRENRKNENKLWLRVTQLESQPQISDHQKRINLKPIAAHHPFPASLIFFVREMWLRLTA